MSDHVNPRGIRLSTGIHLSQIEGHVVVNTQAKDQEQGYLCQIKHKKEAAPEIGAVFRPTKVAVSGGDTDA